jgi:hypothetical protein
MVQNRTTVVNNVAGSCGDAKSIGLLLSADLHVMCLATKSAAF